MSDFIPASVEQRPVALPRRRHFLRTIGAVGVLGILAWMGWPSARQTAVADSAKAAALPDAPPLADAPGASQPGLALTIESAGKTDTRVARLVSLYVPANTPPTPFLPAGPFKATWQGEIIVPLRGDFTFSAAGSGKITVKFGDTVALDAAGDNLDPNKVDAKSTRLKKGKNPITVVYESPATGDASVRLYWSSAGEFQPEPIPPTSFAHNAAAKPIATAARVRQGRELFAELRCARCHAVDSGVTDAVMGMPEMGIDAPSLEDVGGRLNAGWIAQWVSNPHALWAGTAMPKLPAAADPAAAKDVAAYLSSLGGMPDSDKPLSMGAEDVKAGGKIVASLGCIGCHTLPDAKPDAAADADRVPWRNVREKYRPSALVAFLKQPEKHYAWIRMPNFHFADDEAAKVAAYLLSGGKAPENFTGGNAENGSKIVASAGCFACHNLGPKTAVKNLAAAPALADIPKDGWARGCMGKDDAARGKAPDFALADWQRTALLAFAATDRSSLKQDSPVEFAERQITSLRCIACHARDAKTELWDDLAKEVAALGGGEQANPESEPAKGGPPGEPAAGSGDQSRPPLTWIGEKLRPEWAEAFIAGKVSYKPRVWLTARMPSFPARAHGIAHGLALEHGFAPAAPLAKRTDEEAAGNGKKLAGRDGGFACIQCHGIGDTPPLAPFEAPSINFRRVSDRLRKEYYDRWMRNPARVVPTTKMPAFADQDLKTSLVDLYGGDATKQFDAIWQYLLAGEKIAPPEDAAQ